MYKCFMINAFQHSLGFLLSDHSVCGLRIIALILLKNLKMKTETLEEFS